MNAGPLLGVLTAITSGTPIEAERVLVEKGLGRIDPVAPPFDPSNHDPAHVHVLREQWRIRMSVEHRSSTVFSQLAHQLIERNAPIDTQIVMMRMALDELRHTMTCADVVKTLGGVAEREVDLAIQPLAVHAGVPIEERVLRNVLYTTTLSELVACARFSATLERTEDPFLRHALRRLLSDEVLHAQFGFFYLMTEKEWLTKNPDRVQSIERYLVHAFAVIEEELAPKPPFQKMPKGLAALGAEDPAEAREVFYATMEHATAPGIAEFGIDAPRAWRERRRLA
jgi:hypothetical protein